MVNTSQLTRSARLSLAHRIITKNRKKNLCEFVKSVVIFTGIAHVLTPTTNHENLLVLGLGS